MYTHTHATYEGRLKSNTNLFEYSCRVNNELTNKKEKKLNLNQNTTFFFVQICHQNLI